LLELGIDEVEDAIRVIEWPERLPPEFAPRSWISIRFRLEGAARHGMVLAGGAAAERIKA
jgi:hypothetical protein